MATKASPRCGKDVCEHYDRTNKESKCRIYTDRRLCALSMKRRGQNARHSQKQAKKPFGFK